jgi:hypothetical protein
LSVIGMFRKPSDCLFTLASMTIERIQRTNRLSQRIDQNATGM